MEQCNRIELKGVVGFVKLQAFNGSKVARISLVTNYVYKNKGGEPVVETTWHNINAWEGKEIRNLDKIEKGTKLYVAGRLRSQRYTDNEGVDRNSYEVYAEAVNIIDEQLKIQNEL